MLFKPHSYQLEAIQHVVEHEQSVLFLEMGLGKTVITLTALSALLSQGLVKKVLVIAPKRVAQTTWPQEVAKWDHLAGLEMSVLVGNVGQREEALASSAPIHVVNRENVVWLVDRLGVDGWDYDMVVIDELSSFKSPRAQRFKALKRVRSRVGRIVGLTGTPAPNGLLDLWAQYRLVDEGVRLGKTLTSYRESFFRASKYVWGRPVDWVLLPGADDAIYERIGDITLSARSCDFLDLPPVTYSSCRVGLSEDCVVKYGELRRELVAEVGGEVVDAKNAASLSNKLLQFTSGALYAGEDGGVVVRVHDLKLDALADLVEAANGQSLLVAYWFKHELVRIRERFPQARVLDGVEDFEAWNRGEVGLGLIHPASAGHGLNLQFGGHLLVWFTPVWSLELYQQMNARLVRQGQGEPVSVVHIVVEGTLDERVLQVLGLKEATQEDLVRAVRAEVSAGG